MLHQRETTKKWSLSDPQKTWACRVSEQHVCVVLFRKETHLPGLLTLRQPYCTSIFGRSNITCSTVFICLSFWWCLRGTRRNLFFGWLHITSRANADGEQAPRVMSSVDHNHLKRVMFKDMAMDKLLEYGFRRCCIGPQWMLGGIHSQPCSMLESWLMGAYVWGYHVWFCKNERRIRALSAKKESVRPILAEFWVWGLLQF